MKLANWLQINTATKFDCTSYFLGFIWIQGNRNQDYKMNLNGDKLCSSIKICVRSCFPEKDRQFSHLEEDILFGLVDDMCAKVFTNDTIPSRATAFVHLIFEISWEDFFLFVLLDGCFEAFVEVLKDTVDVLLIHVGGLYLRFGLGSGHCGRLVFRFWVWFDLSYIKIWFYIFAYYRIKMVRWLWKETITKWGLKQK